MLAPEIKIQIGGRERLMRPTIKSIMAIENQLGCTSMALMQRLATLDYGARDFLCVLYNGLNGSTDRMERDEIEVEMEERGLNYFLRPIMEFMRAHSEGRPSGKDQPDPSA